MSKFTELLIVIIVILIVALCLPLFKHPTLEDFCDKQETKIEQQEQTLQGMNYNNGEGWYKNCKVKIINDKFNNIENDINEFISEKDIVDIKVTSGKIIVIYIEPSLSEDIIIEEK